MRIPCLADVDIQVPREVSQIYDLAYNYWWAWSPRARRLFSAIDGVSWTRYRNPVELLINVDVAHWESLLGSETFMSTYHSVVKEFGSYMQRQGGTWFEERFGEDVRRPIAYFSMEYGVHESYSGYSGGLGVLSGDHLKSASDLGLPLLAVGLLYRRGYFNQAIDAGGLQQHSYPHYDTTRLPIRPAEGHNGREILIDIDFPDRKVYARVWVAQVGRVPLILLDTEVPQNDPSDRPITSILYVRGREMRIVQEFVLGVGGVRALRALDIDPGVWHLNEGHSGFLQIERLRELISNEGLEYDAALSRIKDATVFTTHTPVPAGNEVFERDLTCKYLDPYADAMKVDCQTLLALGNADHGSSSQPFNLTAFAMRTSRYSNGVSKLHGDVSNEMWRHLFEGAAPDDSPVKSITNGVHSASWLGAELLEMFNRHLGINWRRMLLSDDGWEAVESIPDEEVWAAHQTQKERLARSTRVRLREQYARHGLSPDDLRALDGWFDANALTIGFARRFATYKRASLLFSDLVRLRSLVSDRDRPLQILLAGKAHPADRPGQELIQSLFQLSQSETLRGRVFFLENYGMQLGRSMVQGVDIWLNTPLRPQEASGTSGQKAAMNGALNFSVLDGWWPEAFDGENGWSIGNDRIYHDRELQDLEDAQSLYQSLEESIIPMYYQRGDDGIPHRWVQMMKHSIATIAPRFCAERMVRDYTEQAYFPEVDGR